MDAIRKNRWTNEAVPKFAFETFTSSPRLRAILGFCLFVTAFYLAYRYGMSFSQICAAPFWFPDSVLLCALLLSRPGRWWIVILASLPIRLFVAVPSDVPLWFLLAAFAIDSAKGLATAVALRRFMKDPIRFETVRDFAVFCSFAVLLIPAASAFGGATLRQLLGYAYWPAWEQWFMGDALAQLIVTPAIFYLVLDFPWNAPLPSAKRLIEGGLLTAGLILAGWIAFSAGFGGVGITEPRFYAPVPFLFWAAIRFGMFGASGAIMIISFLSVAAALHGRGPFSGQSPTDTALALQQFLLLRAAPLYLVAILIEQKKGDERSLRESEALNRGIIDSLTSLVVILDRSGRIIAANEAWRKSYLLGGIPAQGIDVGENYLEVCRAAARAGDVSAEMLAGIEDVLSGKETEFQSEYPRVTPGGALWFDILVVPLRSEAGGVVVKLRNITDRKQAEAETQELHHELAHAGRVTMLGQLSSSLAHELNQPLGAILRNAEAAEIFLQSDRPDLDELRAIITDIRKDDQRAGAVIDRLRDLLKRRQLDLCPVSLSSLVDEVVLLTRTDSETRRVVVDVDVPNELPLVHGDRIHLQQVLLNLIINGMDALADITDGSGMLTVCARRDGDDFVEVAVIDNGHGVPAARLGRLFEPFFTMKPHGMGLGLSISKTVIIAHGGRLWAENNPGGGATFRFTLPVAGETRGERRGTRDEGRVNSDR